MITYTPEQVLENIKAIAECREEDINLPGCSKTRNAQRTKRCLNTAYKNIFSIRKYKEYQKKYYQNKKPRQKRS